MNEYCIEIISLVSDIYLVVATEALAQGVNKQIRGTSATQWVNSWWRIPTKRKMQWLYGFTYFLTYVLT